LIPFPVPLHPSDDRAAPQPKARNAALRARIFLTVVLRHHAVIPYTYFGHTDPKFFIGFERYSHCTVFWFSCMSCPPDGSFPQPKGEELLWSS
jgi:hypothetical protein